MTDEATASQETESKGIGGARPGAGAPKGNVNRQTHGLTSLKKAWSRLGNRAIDGRSPAAVALRKWRASVINDLGGKDNISTQQEALVDLACKSKLLLDSVDAWLLTQPSLVNARKRSLYPVVLQRQALADGLARYLTQLGLERRHKVKTISDLLNGDGEAESNGQGGLKE
jgi:hypothetical protein